MRRLVMALALAVTLAAGAGVLIAAYGGIELQALWLGGFGLCR